MTGNIVKPPYLPVAPYPPIRAKMTDRGESVRLTLSVLPLGPTIRCLRFTNLSLFLTSPPILITSHATSSCSTLIACGAATPLASNFNTSLPFKITYGSHVFLVVLTVIFPCTKSSSHASPTESKAEVTEDQTERR